MIHRGHMAITFLIIVVYFWVASTVFTLRHPWATPTETIMHTKQVLLFQKVSYKEMRGSYE